MTTFSIFQ
jgi:hypothetical protein